MSTPVTPSTIARLTALLTQDGVLVSDPAAEGFGRSMSDTPLRIGWMRAFAVRWSVQESFGVTLTRREIRRARTVGDLARVIAAKS